MTRRALELQVPGSVRTADHDAALPIAESVQPIYDLNRRMLELLARPKSLGEPPSEFHADTVIGQLLRAAESTTKEQLALCPFLLLDASFGDATKWRTHADSHNHEHLSGDELKISILELARATALLSWHLTRTQPAAARVIFGMSHECADLVARSRLTELQGTAVRLVHHHWFKPRWHDRPEVWRRLIQLAHTTSPTPARVHGMQLLLGDLLDRNAGCPKRF